MIKLNAAQEGRAKSFLLDLCIRTRHAPNTRSESYITSRYGTPFLSDTFSKVSSEAAQIIIRAMSARTFNFKEVDEALSRIKSYSFSFGDTPTAEHCTWTIRNIAGAAKFLAWICAQNRIYWNDAAYTPAERETWRTESFFANYLFEAECFVSQPSRVKRATRAASAATDPSAGTGTGAAGAPKSGYKSAGPQSAFVAGLIGKPGEKVTVSEPELYCIAGDKAGTIVPKAFIHPVENPAVGEFAKLNADGLPKIKFGAGNGYTDLAILSRDAATMENILAKMPSHLTSKYSGVSVRRTRNDASGYFRVNTEFGEVLVKPTKLNEALFAEVFEAMSCEACDEKPLYEATDPKIIDMDSFIRDSKMYD